MRRLSFLRRQLSLKLGWRGRPHVYAEKGSDVRRTNPRCLITHATEKLRNRTDGVPLVDRVSVMERGKNEEQVCAALSCAGGLASVCCAVARCWVRAGGSWAGPCRSS